MKTDKLLHLIQQKRVMRSGGALPLPKAQNGKASNFLQPNSSKLKEGYAAPSKYPSTELATSIGGEGGKPAYLVPSFKYGHPLANPEDEFYNTGDYLGGPFKTWQEADKWDREIRHPYVEKGESIPSPLKWWGEGYRDGGSLPIAKTGITAPCPPGLVRNAQGDCVLQVTDPNDSRLKAYNDSSSLYNQGIATENFLRTHGFTNAVTHEFPFSQVTSYSGYATKPKGKIQPVSAVSQETDPSHPSYYRAEWLKYKEPVRKVELKKEDIQKAERPAFDFSLNEDEDIQPIAPTTYTPDPVRKVMNPRFNTAIDNMPNRTKKAVVDELGNPRYKYYNQDKLISEQEYKKLMQKRQGGSLPKAQDGTITDPYIGMRKFYNDAYDALGKYENKQGEVSPFNVSRAWAKAAVKNPYLLFRDRHNLAEQGFSEDQIMSNAQNPYHKDSPVIRMSDTETRYQHPTDYVVPNEKDVERYNRYIANQTQQKSSKGNGFDLSDEWRDVKRGVRNTSRDVRHFIGKEVPRALRNCVNGNCYEFHQDGGNTEGLYNKALQQYNTLKSGPAEAWNGDPANLTPDGNLNLCLDCINIDWENEQDVRDANRLIEEGYSMGTHESHDAYVNGLKKFNLTEPVYNSKKITQTNLPENKQGGSLPKAQTGIQQQLINQALSQNNASNVRSTVTVAPRNLQQQSVAKDIATHGSIEKAAQAKAARQAQTTQKESNISTPKIGQGNYEYYNPEQGEYRDDKTIAPKGSLRGNVQNNLNAYNEFISNQTSMLQNLPGPGRGVDAIAGIASDLLVNGPIQSAINLSNTAMGDRPIRGDKDFGNLFFDAFNAMPVFSSMFKGAKTFNQASRFASEAAFSPTLGIMPGAMQEGLESSSRFLKKTPVTIPGGIKKGADDVIAGNLFDEGIIRMEEADMPMTDIMLGHASIPANMTGVQFVKDALQSDPVLKREIATIVRDLNKDYGLTLDFKTIDSIEELQKIKESAIDFLQSSDPRAVNARSLFTEKLQQTDATAVRTDINTRHIKLNQLNKKKKDLSTEMVGLNRGDSKIVAIQDEITKINDQIRNVVQNPTEILFPSGIKYEGRSQMTSKGPVADVKITSVKPGVNGMLSIKGDEPNLFNHFYFVSGDLNYTKQELNRLKALTNPDQYDLEKIAGLEQKITDSLMASGEMFKVSTMNAPKGTVVTETSMSSDSYGMLWNMGKTTTNKKTPYKLLTPGEFSQYDSLKDNWLYSLDVPVERTTRELLAKKETAGIPLVLPYKSPNTMGYAEGVGKRAPNPNALGIKNLQGNHLNSIDEVALGVNTQNNLFETANKTFEYQLANRRISQEFYDANIIKWYENPLDSKSTALTTTAPKVSAAELASLDPAVRKRFAPVQVPNDTHLNSPIFIDRNSGGFTWEGMNAKDSPFVYKYLGIGTNPGDFATFNNNAISTYFQQAIPTFKKEWKKGGVVKAQKGLANFGYENRMPRESTSTMYTPPTGYSHPKVHPISTWFENMIIGAIPYLGDAVDFGRGTLALKEGDDPHAFLNYLGAAMPFVAGTTLQNGYDALGDYIHDHYINKPRESDPKKAKGGSTSKKLNAQQQYFQLLINQKNKK